MAQRNTKQRQIVLDVVKNRCDHPTAEQIFDEVHAIDPRISRGTVYRNLNVLERQSMLTQVRAPEASRFDRRCDKHYHLICTRCGQVCDAPIEYQQTSDEAVAQLTGFQITSHQALFEGICPACQKATQEEAKGIA